MSIKGSAKKNTIEYVLPVFAIFTALTTVIRMYQAFTIIEPETGFYSESNATVTALYGLLFLASAVIFVLCYVSRKVPAARLPKGRNIPVGIFSLLASLTVFYDAAKQITDFFDSYINSKSLMIFGQPSQSLFSVLMKNGAIPKCLEGIFAIFSAIYFLVFAVKYFGSSFDLRNMKALAVMPVFWATARMIQRFTRTISFIFVSDLLLELFMIAFLMLFLLYFAQLASHINSQYVMNKVFAYGLISSMFAFTISIPKIIVAIVRPEFSVVTNPVEFCDVSIAVFIVMICFSLLKMPRSKNLTLREVEKMQKESKE